MGVGTKRRSRRRERKRERKRERRRERRRKRRRKKSSQTPRASYPVASTVSQASVIQCGSYHCWKRTFCFSWELSNGATSIISAGSCWTSVCDIHRGSCSFWWALVVALLLPHLALYPDTGNWISSHFWFLFHLALFSADLIPHANDFIGSPIKPSTRSISLPFEWDQTGFNYAPWKNLSRISKECRKNLSNENLFSRYGSNSVSWDIVRRAINCHQSRPELTESPELHRRILHQAAHSERRPAQVSINLKIHSIVLNHSK